MKYRKKPVVIEAVQWTGNNRDALEAFTGYSLNTARGNSLAIQTLEGIMFASVGDYVIKGVQGEIYPCKPDIFQQTYESVEE